MSLSPTIPSFVIIEISKYIPQSHYSLKGAASTVGLGLDNCREVPVDGRGRMDPSSLRKIIEEDKAKGFLPFFVNCAR